MNDLNHRIWAYLHDELPPEDRERFEQELENDPKLRQALEERLSTHQALAELLPQLDISDDGTSQEEEQLLAEWESEHPEYRERVNPSRRRIIRFVLPLAAVAAAMILLMALPSHEGPVRWQRTVYGAAPQLRGQSGEQSGYSRTELEHVNKQLQDAIEARLAKLPAAPEPWVLKIRLQELANGFLAAEVTGHPHDNPDQSKVWSTVIQGTGQVEEQAANLVHQMGNDLSGRNDP